MPAPWSEFEPIVRHTFSLVAEANRADLIDICYANDVSDEVIDGFDALDGRQTYHSVEETKEALAVMGALSD